MGVHNCCQQSFPGPTRQYILHFYKDAVTLTPFLHPSITFNCSLKPLKLGNPILTCYISHGTTEHAPTYLKENLSLSFTLMPFSCAYLTYLHKEMVQGVLKAKAMLLFFSQWCFVVFFFSIYLICCVGR